MRRLGGSPPVKTNSMGELLCHLLFGVSKNARADGAMGDARQKLLWEANLAFRCAAPRYSQRRGDARVRGADVCHVTGGAHYTHVVTPHSTFDGARRAKFCPDIFIEQCTPWS
jgi:hypothetical protein